MKKFLVALLLILSTATWADTIEINSLLQQFNTAYKTDVKKAMNIISAAEAQLGGSTPDKFYVTIYRSKGDAYIVASLMDSAKMYFDKCEKYIAPNDYANKGNLANSRSNIYSRSGDIKTAIEYLLEAVRNYEKANAMGTNWAVLQNLAICYAQSGLLDKSLQYFREEIPILKEIKVSDPLLGDVYTNLGVVYGMKNELDSAFRMYKLSYDLHSAIGQSPALAMLLNNMGAVLMQQNKILQGIEYLKKGLDMMRASGDMEGAMMGMNNLADVFTEGNELDKALSYALQAYRLADSLHYKNHLATSCDRLSYIYHKKGDEAKAYEYCRRFAALNDSLKSSDNMKTIAEMEAKYESDKKEKAIELLNKDKELQSSQLAREQNFKYSLAGISALVLLVAILLFLSLRRKQKTNRELDLKNQKIQMAYHIIEEKQKEILDSIYYARRIQRSLLTQEKYIQSNLTKLRR